MEAIGELHEDHPQIAHHGEQHFSEGLRLLLLLRDVGVAGDFGNAVDQLRNVVAEHLLQLLLRGQRVFEDVVQQAHRDGCLVEMEIGEDVGNIQRMHQIWFAGVPNLSAVR